MRIFASAALCAVISSPALAGTVYELDLVSSSQSGIVSFEVARTGSDRFHAARFVTAPLQDGGEFAGGPGAFDELHHANAMANRRRCRSARTAAAAVAICASVSPMVAC